MSLPTAPVPLGDLPGWIAVFATSLDDAEALFDGVCRSFGAAGIPLWRASVSVPALDPTLRAVGSTWWRDRPVIPERVEHGPETTQVFERSPVYALSRSGEVQARWDLASGQGCASFPLLDDLRRQGGTDYVLRLVYFAEGSGARGMALSLAADHPGGFSDDDIAAMEGVLPALGLAVFRMIQSRTLRDTLGVYLGARTASRVLAGETRRGQGSALSAAILFADLRGFTALADHEDGHRVVALLDRHLEAVGEEVESRGGEILKFLGDGLLVVFPVEQDEARPCPDCDRAFEAAEAALRRNAVVARSARAIGEPALDLDVALHYGTVVYGNVGVRRRLDFTVIGRAVNEASRLEALCEPLSRSLLCSDSFAQRCGRPLAKIGAFAMRGVAAPRTVWALPSEHPSTT